MTRFLVLSAHDYRSRRKAGIHFVAQELAKLGTTRFFSLGFSRLSRRRGRDPRLGLESIANRIGVTTDGVECYLWHTPVHPFNPGRRYAQGVASIAFEVYRRCAPAVLREWVQQSDAIVVESGIGVLMLRDLRRWNPSAQIIYLASDDLRTVQAAPYLQHCLLRDGSLLDHLATTSALLLPNLPTEAKRYVVPHGIDSPAFDRRRPSPFADGVHAVSVGSMLFDTDFFWSAVESHPHIQFWVIGSGVARSSLPKSVHYIGELPFDETIGYLQHAAIGLAPYRLDEVPYYLCDTSMKLMQYEYLGLPAVCPFYAVGGRPHRYGYTPGDRASIASALDAAERAPRLRCAQVMSWTTVVQHLLTPEAYGVARV
jgi:2-beta-glucuronyltransferase